MLTTVIAGVQRVPTRRRRDIDTTKKVWTGRTIEEEWHNRAEDTVNVQLHSPRGCHRSAGILLVCRGMILWRA